MARLKSTQNALQILDHQISHKAATAESEKGNIPIGWALLVLGTGCALFWGALAFIL